MKMTNKKRMIDRNEIFPNGTFFANAEDPLKSLDELIKRIWSIPTVDAVEVVRCKDCRWRKQGKLCYMISGCGVPVGTGDDFFCQYGERRTDETL